MTGGLLGLAAVLASALLWTLHTAVWTLALTLMAMAYLDEQRGSIHESKAGVGSAMNDVNRQVGGALGVAIISSIVNSVYRSGVSDAVAQLPAGARHAARDSIGSAHAVAQHLPAAAAQHLDTAAASAFTDALGVAFLAAAIAAAAAASLVVWLLGGRGPSRSAVRARSRRRPRPRWLIPRPRAAVESIV